MLISTIVPTIGRSTLARAVTSALTQGLAHAEHEVIVVNDSGFPLEQADWQGDPRVTIITTQRHERCFARNVGAATARGRYLHFLDDDDWLAHGALAMMAEQVLAQRGGEPRWIYGWSQLVDREDKPLIQLHHDLPGNCFAHLVAGEWIPIQSSLFEAALFFELGGFDPHIPGAEDADLTRRFALVTNAVVCPQIVANIRMGTRGSSTDYEKSRVYIRAARERVLDEPLAFGQFIRTSSTAYLRGRVVRVFFTSVLWNVQARRGLTAVGRAFFGLAALVRTPRYLFDRSFWRALFQEYRNETFERGFERAGLPFVRNTLGR